MSTPITALIDAPSGLPAVVARGIERPAEVKRLSEPGVRCGQGSFFARPAPRPLPLRPGATSADHDSDA